MYKSEYKYKSENVQIYGPKCQYILWPPLFSSSALTLLDIEFNRASQVAPGVLFHSLMMTSRSWWMLKTLHSSKTTVPVIHVLSLLVFSKLFTFTFIHLADAFIQSDLQCIQAIHLYCQYVCSLGIKPTTFALLTQCSNHWATGTHVCRLSCASSLEEASFWDDSHADQFDAVCGVWSEHWQADPPPLQHLKQCWQHSYVYFPNITSGYDAEHVHSTSLVNHGEACSEWNLSC